METPTNVVRLRHPEDLDDPLTEVLRSGARRLLAQAVEMEADAFLSAMQDLRLQDGRARLVRHGHGPERAIQTGIGPVSAAQVRVRDRGASGSEDRVRFTSTLLPKWARRTRSLDALLPVLYLRGVSTGDIQDALAALLGRDAPNLSPAVIARLTAAWADECARWQGRDLSARCYAYVWADGVYLQARMPDDLWDAIAPLLPPPRPRPKGGRRPIENRAVLTGILFVLRSGLPWEMLPAEMGCGCGMSCWRRLRDWQEAGVWARLHQVLLARQAACRQGLRCQAPTPGVPGPWDRAAHRAQRHREQRAARPSPLGRRSFDKLRMRAPTLGSTRFRRLPVRYIAVNGAVSKTGKVRKTAIDRRTTRHVGYAISLRCRKRIDKV